MNAFPFRKFNFLTNSAYENAEKKDNEVYAVETPCVVETYNSGTSGYRLWSDGLIEQWGQSNATNNATIDLLKPFDNTDYCLVSTFFDGTGYCKKLSTTQIYWHAVANENYQGICWYAFGY